MAHNRSILVIGGFSHIGRFRVPRPVRAGRQVTALPRIVQPAPNQRYHHEAHICADITAARRALGYEPKYTPETALQRAVEWMQSKEMAR